MFLNVFVLIPVFSPCHLVDYRNLCRVQTEFNIQYFSIETVSL